MARVIGEFMYQLYRHWKCLNKLVEVHVEAFRVDLANGAGFEEIRQFQEHISD